MELFKNTNFDFLAKKWPFIIASLVLTAAGLASLVAKGGPHWGIDFRGGAMVYVKFADRPPVEQLRKALGDRLGQAPEIQEVTSGTPNEVIVNTEARDEKALAATRETIINTLATMMGKQEGKLDLNNAGQDALVGQLRQPLATAGANLPEQQLRDVARRILEYKNTPPRSGLLRSLNELAGIPGVAGPVMNVLQQQTYLPPYTIRGVEIVGPKVGAELKNQAILATLYALGAMLVYIGFRFEWIYGVAAVIAVFHDTIITIGLFSLFNKEISLTVVAALLTLVGYSMNDTIVVFDRIRENLKLTRREPLERIVNLSINQTLSRTILTSGLTLLTALSLWIFGGQVLNGFAFALVVGIIIGTYSSIFIASPILIFWQNYLEGRKRSAVAVSPAREAVRGRGVVKPVK